MVIFKKKKDLEDFLQKRRKNGATIGFVPTMGALHKGHISLINTSKFKNTLTVCSIFVNPTQFNNSTDFEKYPNTLEIDINLLEQNECDVLFLPSTVEIYPAGVLHLPQYKLGFLETILEGKYRPGHFQGVCQIVHLLLLAVQPTTLYIGQKDFQQCLVIKKLIEITQQKVDVIICETLRESDGLAMSSRNMRLNDGERIKAVKIYEVLSEIKKNIKPGNLLNLKEQLNKILSAHGFSVDYVEIVSTDTFEILENWDGKQKIVALVAAYINQIRLIDNMLIN